MPEISVIIPVYNAARFLEECLGSVTLQDFQNLEIICINDGSTDNSLEILQDFQKRDSRIKIFSQENKGVSVARNLGLENSNGKYVLFLDSDDYLQEDVLSKAYSFAEKNNLDLLYLEITCVDVNGKVAGFLKMDYDQPKVLNGFKHQRTGYIAGLYNKETISEIRFAENVDIAEDTLFNIMVHTVSSKISYLPESSYFYRQHDSASKKIANNQNEKTFQGMMKNFDILAKFIHENSSLITESNLSYYDRPYYLLGKMCLEMSVIPYRSTKRFLILKKKLKELKLNKTFDKLSKEYYFFNQPLIFIKSHFLYLDLLNWLVVLKNKVFKHK